MGQSSLVIEIAAAWLSNHFATDAFRGGVLDWHPTARTKTPSNSAVAIIATQCCRGVSEWVMVSLSSSLLPH